VFSQAERSPGVVVVLVRERDAAKACEVDSRVLGSAPELLTAEAGIDQEGLPSRADRNGIPPGSRSQHTDRGHRASLACMARNDASMAGVTSTFRRGMTRLAMVMNPSHSTRFAPSPQEKGGMYRGGEACRT
jgi:hypothetical protein